MTTILKMKRFLTVLATLFSLKATAAPQVTMVDPKSLLYSLATINDALPATEPTPPEKGDLILHEDDWRQFEAVSTSLRPQIESELADIRKIFAENSVPLGQGRAFKKLHVRSRIPNPIVSSVLWAELLKALDITDPKSGVAFRQDGAVKGGFSLRVAELSVYGVREGDRVHTVALINTWTPRLSAVQAERLAAFLEKNGLILVHWYSGTILEGKSTLTQYFSQQEKPK